MKASPAEPFSSAFHPSPLKEYVSPRMFQFFQFLSLVHKDCVGVVFCFCCGSLLGCDNHSLPGVVKIFCVIIEECLNIRVWLFIKRGEICM